MDNSFFNFKLFHLEDLESSALQLNGENQKECLVLYQTKEDEASILNFMAKVLQAIQIELKQDTLFINVKHASPINLNGILRKYPAKNIFIFGLSPQQLGLHFEIPKYHIINHQDIQYLRADGIDAIYQERQSGGKELSAKLWKSMKQL